MISLVVETKEETNWASGQVIQQGECPGSELPIMIGLFPAAKQLFQGVKHTVEITKTLPGPIGDRTRCRSGAVCFSFTSAPLLLFCDLPIRFSLFVCY